MQGVLTVCDHWQQCISRQYIVCLQGRMSDTNRNLTAKTLLLLCELAKAMGPAFESVGRPLMSVSVANLSDNKSQVIMQICAFEASHRKAPPVSSQNCLVN